MNGLNVHNQTVLYLLIAKVYRADNIIANNKHNRTDNIQEK